MEQGPLFEKELKEADINHRLSFPTKHIDILPPFPPGSNEVGFHVRYGEEEHLYTFWCIKRGTGCPKPTICRGWSDVVRDKQLQIGDLLRFYAGEGQHETTHYRIEVRRRQLEYSDDYGETWSWFRI